MCLTFFGALLKAEMDSYFFHSTAFVLELRIDTIEGFGTVCVFVVESVLP